MQIILLSDVEKLGLRGEVVSVADGYARNYLLPRRLAERATPTKIAEVRRREERRALQEARTLEQGQQIADLLRKTVLTFDVKAGPTGALFGSVTPTDIADEIWRTRKVRVDRRRIELRDPIKRIGRYVVPIEVFQDVTVEVKTLVVPEGGELPPEEELEAMVAAEVAATAPPESEGLEELEAALAEYEPEPVPEPSDEAALAEPEPASEPADDSALAEFEPGPAREAAPDATPGQSEQT